MQVRYIFPLSLALALATTGLAHSEGELTAEQMVALEGELPQAETLQVTGSVDRENLTYAIGETVRFFVESNEDAYVVILNVGPEGDVTQLFPNAFQSDNFVAANQTIEVPAADSGFSIAAREPVGAELVKVFASSEPIEVVPEAQLEGDGAFRSLKGGVSQLARNLEVIADAPAEPERMVATHNLVIRTVETAAEAEAASPTFVVQPSEPEAMPAAASDDAQDEEIEGVSLEEES